MYRILCDDHACVGMVGRIEVNGYGSDLMSKYGIVRELGNV
jgi:hypothetical protein